jgi:hypothetical protein
VRIPTDPQARLALYSDLVQKCSASRDTRSNNYDKWRSWYLFGSNGGKPAKFNKIFPHIDQLTSFMYTQETTKFSTNVGPSVSDLQLPKVPVINRAVLAEWHSSNGDIIFGHALTWSFVYGSMFVKTRWHGTAVEPYVVYPHDVGVLREDIPMLSRQEAFCHWYFVSKSQLEYELTVTEHKRKTEILANASTRPLPERGGKPANRVEVTGIQPVLQGTVNMWPEGSTEYRATVDDEMVELCELTVWDDEKGDYRLATCADPDIVIYDREMDRIFIKGEYPLIQVCPSPSPDYFWGFSETERLMPLQKLREERMVQITHILDKQANPPKWMAGFTGVADEMALALDTPGGMIQSDNPGAKADAMAPNVPEDMFKEVAEIDKMFEEMSGITNVMQGRGEQGVRSQAHAGQLAQLGSSRAKKRALIVEDSLEHMATMYLKIMRKYDSRSYRGEDGIEFVIEQFTEDFNVKVDAHSNSPLFNENQNALVFELLKAGAIDLEETLMLVDVPMRELLLHNLRTKILPQRAKQAAQEQQMQAAHAQAQGKVSQMPKRG